MGFLPLRPRLSWSLCLESEPLGAACNNREIKKLNSLKAFTSEGNHSQLLFSCETCDEIQVGP